MKAFIYLFVLGQFLFSCSKKQIIETDKLSLYDSVSISIDYSLLSLYVKLVPYCIDNSVYATGYNFYEHSIDFIDLTGGNNFILSLQREGPNGVLPVQDYCFVADKIVCKDESGILTLSMDGSVIKRLSIKELVSPAEKYSVRPRGGSLSDYQYLNSWNDKVFVSLSPVMKDDFVHIGKIYDVSKHLLEFLPPCYPSEVVDFAQYLGSLSIPDINMHSADKIVYNFPFSSQVYLYDVGTAETKILDVRSQMIDNELDFEEWKGMDLVDKAQKEISLSRFGRVYYSSSLDKYYRIHYGKENVDGGMPRNIYLMVFDESGSSIKEYLLPKQFTSQYFFLHDTLFFACRSNNDMSFKIAKISLDIL